MDCPRLAMTGREQTDKYKYKKMNKYAVGSNRLINWIFPKYESFHLLMISLI